MWISLHTSYSNEEITIQTEHIVSVTARGDNRALIALTNGEGLAVKESAEEVKQKLEDAALLSY